MSGPQCCENPPNVAAIAAVEDGIEGIGGLKSYTAGSPASKLAVVLISDIFGYEAPKLRQIADKVAAAGFYVVVPDFFHGDPYVADNTERPLSSWINDHQPVKGRGVSAVGAAGFCWGGMAVSKLSRYSEIEADVILHPGPLSDDDINAIKVPTAILGAELDQFAPPELDQFTHGWTLRYEDDDEHAVKCAMEAYSDMLNWFTKYMK